LRNKDGHCYFRPLKSLYSSRQLRLCPLGEKGGFQGFLWFFQKSIALRCAAEPLWDGSRSELLRTVPLYQQFLKKKGRFSVLFSCENIGEGTERFSKNRQILWQEVPNIIEKHSAILLVHHKATHFFEQKKFREKQD